ncbi:MAG TPA: DinB family protein [Alloacidobacterium sp.]|nr:DinB family protein [Alloacidobacterium sp.]
MSELQTKVAPAQQPEPWLRGTLADVPAVVRGVLHALELAQEDVDRWCESLSEDDLNARPFELPQIAFHLRHIARSLDRLLWYAEGNQLSAEQIAALKSEMESGAGREALFAEFSQGLESAAQRVLALAAGDLEQPCFVGKKQLPTSVGGLLVHLADHTQRHVGQIVTTAKVLLAGK